MLAVRGEALDRLGAQRVDRVPAPPERRGRVDLVDDQQVERRGVRRWSTPESTSSSSDWARRSFSQSIDTISRGNDVKTLAPTPRSRRSWRTASVLTIRNSSPNRSRISSCHFTHRPAGHTTSDGAGPVAQQQLLDDEPGLDRLAEADVVGDQQVRPRHAQRADHGIELVVLDRDARPERCLQGLGVGGGHGAPPHGVEERVEPLRRVELARARDGAAPGAG